MKISVAIPTIKGREKYLEKCLMTCVTQANEDFEILVSDNSLGHGASDLVSQMGDERIRYVYPPKYLPMSMHWDFVLSQVSGDVLTIIGDDDGLMPDCINKVSELIREYPTKIIHHSLCNYFWPDYTECDDRNSILFFHDVNNDVAVVNASDILQGLCDGRLRYIDGPMVYHNFVPTDLLRKLTRDGVFFRRASPDVYSAVALAANVDSFISTRECLTISGQGARANGAPAMIEGEDGNRFIDEALAFYKPRFNLDLFKKAESAVEVARIVEIALLDCIFEVAEEFSRPSLVDNFVIKKRLFKALCKIEFKSGWQRKALEFLKGMRIGKSVGILAPLLVEAVILTLRDKKRRYKRRLKRFKRYFTPKSFTDGVNHDNSNMAGNDLRAHSRLKMDQSVTNIYEASVALDKLIRANLG